MAGANKPQSVMAESDADLVIATNDSSIVSKRSVEARYYPQRQFFRPFVRKFQRRAPLINRGYWLRMHAIEHTVRRFLQEPSDGPKFVVNLGCGYDPLPFQLLDSDPSLCKNTVFVDVDYEKLISIKSAIIQQAPEFQRLVGSKFEVYPEHDVVRLRASQYAAVGCDLKDLGRLERGLQAVLGSTPASILCIAEVSLTYMDVESADALISWIPRLGKDVRFCLLEQYFPDGPGHPFAATMIKHFEKLRAPLHSIHHYPTMKAQEKRFTDRGWQKAYARSLWDVWNDDEFLEPSKRSALDKVEQFDEWEEFALFASHYFLLLASTDAHDGTVFPSSNESETQTPDSRFRLLPNCPPRFTAQRRFAAAIANGDNSVGVHGGVGRQSRLLSTDVYVWPDETDVKSYPPPPEQIPVRICHTITGLPDYDCLLVGGRTAPTSVLSDCWVRQHGRWEPVQSLPSPRFRHSATGVYLDNSYVLVYGGKSDTGETLSDWQLWSRQQGWQTLHVDCEGDLPRSRFGACLVAIDDNFGILFGGMTQDGVVLNDFWLWTVSQREDGTKSVHLANRTSSLHDATPVSKYLGRFGATVAKTGYGVFVIGGIGQCGVLPAAFEVILVDSSRLCDDRDGKSWNQSILSPIGLGVEPPQPRPLLIGHASSDVASSREPCPGDGSGVSDVLIMGGGAVCFSFGTFWNNGTWLLQPIGSPKTNPWQLQVPSTSKETATPPTPAIEPQGKMNSAGIVQIPRRPIRTAAEFEEILSRAEPVVITDADIGRCTELWTKEYLTQTVGFNRKVVVHEARSEHMNFQKKNFEYVTKDFGEFLQEVYDGSRQYLRSISTVQPAKQAANLAEDFPELSNDFRLPPQLALVNENAHSSPLRISGPVTMWLHYDVMANVLCQIRGQKRLILYPPSDVQYLQIPPGASSSSLNIFHGVADGDIVSIPHTTPHEAVLKPGEILFIPPLWLHTTSPVGGVSIAVNVFFRNLRNGYAPGRDVYANRDLKAYEDGRVQVDKIARMFDGLPSDMARFYLLRLADELRQKALG